MDEQAQQGEAELQAEQEAEQLDEQEEREDEQEVLVPLEPQVSTNEVRRAYLSGRYLRLYARSFDLLGKST